MLPLNYAAQRCLSIKLLQLTKKFRINWQHQSGNQTDDGTERSPKARSGSAESLTPAPRRSRRPECADFNSSLPLIDRRSDRNVERGVCGLEIRLQLSEIS